MKEQTKENLVIARAQAAWVLQTLERVLWRAKQFKEQEKQP